jgi:hypothetical protein
MRGTAQADASQGKTKLSSQKALRLAFCCVIRKAQCSCLFAREGVGNRASVLFLIQSDQEAIEFDRQRLAIAARELRARGGEGAIGESE